MSGIGTASRSFRHPDTGEPLLLGEGGHLYSHGQVAFESGGGSFDFVTDPHAREEREHYDAEYSTGGWTTQQPLDEVDFSSLWRLDVSSRDYLASFGDVAGKRVLLLGNGTSVKELYFLTQGADVTFTDLSLEAVNFVRRRFEASKMGVKYADKCRFHAVDAMHLPFDDGEFDIVCADAVIHHMDDMHGLMSEIHRCLKPGGICRFADTAYSPAWQAAKKGALRALQKKVHGEHGISPEDQRATDRGGYSLDEIESIRSSVGFSSLYYKRVALLDYLLWRAHCNLRIRWILAFRPLMRGTDKLLTKIGVMQTHGIALVLGFGK